MRLARLLGPAQSVRVVRALSREQKAAIGPERRRLLKAVPGLALGGAVLTGGTAFAGTGQSRSESSDIDFKVLQGAEATEALEDVASDSSVRDLAHRLGTEPSHVIRNGLVEQIPKGIRGPDPQRYVSITWVDNAQQIVRTSHFVSPDGTIESNIFKLTKTGSDPTVEYGELGGKTVTVTESEAKKNQPDVAVAQGFVRCMAACMGITVGAASVIIAGCSAACFVIPVAGCVICLAAASGLGAGAIGGCVAGCS